jgi:redox-sensitive bicupin YhaK (pirin superfamily)
MKLSAWASMFECIIVPPTRDLGEGFLVRRALPSPQCRAVGPFVFFDHFGPTTFQAGAGLDVRPHPHIGLATVTYLFDGEILHRDSLGSAQLIRPGEVNWMIAGGGIAHSERTDPIARRGPSSLSGIQTWVALPQDQEECAASFSHHGADQLPLITGAGRRIRVIAGTLFSERSPVSTLSAMGYADAVLEPGAELHFACEYSQRAIYLAHGAIESRGTRFDVPQLLMARARETVAIKALAASRLMLFGGEPLDGPRYVDWNFVSSSRARIEQAKVAWREGRFDRVPGDEREFIPLPPHTAAPGGSPEGEAL